MCVSSLSAIFSFRCQPFCHFAVSHFVSSLSAILSFRRQPFCQFAVSHFVISPSAILSVRCQPFCHFAVSHFVSTLSAILSFRRQPFCQFAVSHFVNLHYTNLLQTTVNARKGQDVRRPGVCLLQWTVLSERLNFTISVLSYCLTICV